jgi:hypothetical protein
MSMIARLAVKRNVLMHPKQTAVVLNRLAGGTVAYAHAYGFPIDSTSGLASQSAATQTATIVLYQDGEAYAPEVDDWITQANGTTKFNISSVRTESNYASDRAVHTCNCTRKA